MVAKTSEARRRAFLSAVRETGNQTLAAERAKVSRAWVQLHRTRDPEFRAELAAAVIEAKARLDSGGGTTPGPGWRTRHGEELIVRGSNGRWTQVARARFRQWTPRVEGRFLAALTQSCNVKAACAEVGLSQASAYTHRKRWPAFAERWDQAIEDGYDRLAMALVASACAMLGDPEVVPEPSITGMTVDQALRTLGLHRATAHGVGRAPGRRPRVRPLEEVRASILRKVEAIRRASRAEAAGASR